MKNKAPEFKPEYTYETLKQIYKDVTNKAKSDTLTAQEASLGVAAGHAMDFIDTARASKLYLDATARTEDAVMNTLIRVYFSELQSGKSTEEGKVSLIKKFGSYQLFAIVNSMNADGKTVEIAYEGSVLSNAMPKPVIRSVKSKDGKVHTFDVFDAASDAINGMALTKQTEGGTPILFGTLQPFYQRFQNDLMNYLTEE